MIKEQKNNLIIGGLIMAILIVLFVVLPNDTNEQNNDKNVEVVTPNEEEVTTTDVTTDLDGNMTIQGGVIKVETPSQNTGAHVPSLDREISIPDYFGTEGTLLMLTKIDDAVEKAKGNERSFDNWLTLGNLYSQIEDYEGALEVYEYVNRLSPENNVGYTNIGNIYHYHLQDFEKAETNYLLSITKDVSSENAYLELHTLYKNVYKTDTTAAADILLEGLSINPESINFMIALSSYYALEQDAVTTRTYLEKALQQAKKNNDIVLIKRFESDLEALTLEL